MREEGEQELGRYIGNAEQLNFSYPFGDVTVQAKKKVGPAMRSCRGIFPGLDGPMVDLNLLHANSLYGADERFRRSRVADSSKTHDRTAG